MSNKLSTENTSNSHVNALESDGSEDNASFVFSHFKELLSTKKNILRSFRPRKLSPNIKILYIDIETSPIMAMTWGCFNQFISPKQIIHPSSILSYAAQWDSEKEVKFDSVHKSTFKSMMQGLHDLLSEADIVVHYNGKKFDIPRINREFVKLRMGPPDRYAQIDMLQIVRGVGGFDTNKLEWVSQAIGIGAKIENAGWPLWIGCMKGEKGWWKKMETYNKQDTRLLQYLYHTYLPWIRTHPNVAIFESAEGNAVSAPTCTNCGSTKLIKKGKAKTRTQIYQRYKCTNCGTHVRGRSTMLDKETRSNILIQEA
jgi:DNA-directed RNA polymerase subunit RPC12/RpoP/DNA polymerase elongation subunit (family B)